MKNRKPQTRRVSRSDFYAVAPDEYQPENPRDLIGPARQIATGLLKQSPPRKILLSGGPGCGKTTIANIIARRITAHWIDVEKVNGRHLTIELVREWQRNAVYGSLFGAWKVKMINEVDLVSQWAQDSMLTYLDELPEQTAVIATSNQNVNALTERFQTRFRLIHVEGPRQSALSAFLSRRWNLPKPRADFIALGACGNVRAALLDAADFLTFGKNEHRPICTAPMKKAWATARNGGNGKTE